MNGKTAETQPLVSVSIFKPSSKTFLHFKIFNSLLLNILNNNIAPTVIENWPKIDEPLKSIILVEVLLLAYTTTNFVQTTTGYIYIVPAQHLIEAMLKVIRCTNFSVPVDTLRGRLLSARQDNVSYLRLLTFLNSPNNPSVIFQAIKDLLPKAPIRNDPNLTSVLNIVEKENPSLKSILAIKHFLGFSSEAMWSGIIFNVDTGVKQINVITPPPPPPALTISSLIFPAYPPRIITALVPGANNTETTSTKRKLQESSGQTCNNVMKPQSRQCE